MIPRSEDDCVRNGMFDWAEILVLEEYSGCGMDGRSVVTGELPLDAGASRAPSWLCKFLIPLKNQSRV